MSNFAARLLFLAACLWLAGPARGEIDGIEKLKAAQTEFRVCADPDNLPFTNAAGQGFDNKIAELFAKAENKPLVYYWWPLRRGFFSYTLGRWNCDVVLDVPAGYELTATTRPYYCSSYVEVRPAEPVEGAASRPVGVVVSTPPLDLLLRHNEHPIVYLPNDPDSPDYSGKILPDLLSGRIRAAYIWGPIAGYFAHAAPGKVIVSPLTLGPTDRDIRMVFPMSVGVRHGDRARLARLDSILSANETLIKETLANYGVPLVEDPLQCAPPHREASLTDHPKAAPASFREEATFGKPPAGLIRVANEPQSPQLPSFQGDKVTACHGSLTMDEVNKIGQGQQQAEGKPYTVQNGKADEKTYNGWIRFAVTCERCHGPSGVGSALAPDLTQMVKNLDRKQFEAIVSCGLTGNLGIGVMPTFQNDPNVKPYLDDLWAYLKARADGALPPGRPQKLAEAGAENKSASSKSSSQQ